MIYFVHGHGAAHLYNDNSIQISEYNNLSTNNITREIIIEDDTPDNYFRINNDEFHITELLYSFELKDNIKHYGFVSAEETEDSFWSTLIKLINSIVRNNQKIKNIIIPISLFRTIYKKEESERLICKVDDVLSAIKQFDFFILLKNKFEISFIYDTFDMGSLSKEVIFHKEACIVSRIADLDDLLEPFIVLNKKLGLGICNFAQLNTDFEKLKKLKEDLKRKEDQEFNVLRKRFNSYKNRNFSKDIIHPMNSFYDWFIKKDYASYKKIYKYAHDNNTGLTKKEKENFFRLFGYIDSDNKEGRIPEKLRIFISEKSKGKDYNDIAKQFSKFDSQMYSILKENGKDQLVSKWFKKDASSWSEDILRKFKFKRNFERDEYSKKYLIKRDILFYWVLYFNLDIKNAEAFFNMSDCTLETNLLEDKSLIKILETTANLGTFEKKAEEFIKRYFELWKV